MTNPVTESITERETPTAAPEGKALSAAVAAMATALTSASAWAEKDPQGTVDRVVKAGKTAVETGKDVVEATGATISFLDDLKDAWNEMNFFQPPAPALISWAFLVTAIMVVIKKKEWKGTALIPSIILTRLALGGVEHWAPEYLWHTAAASTALGGYLALYQKKEFWMGLKKEFRKEFQGAFEKGSVRRIMRYIKEFIKPSKPPAPAPAGGQAPQEAAPPQGQAETLPPKCSGCGTEDMGPGACCHWCGTSRVTPPAGASPTTITPVTGPTAGSIRTPVITVNPVPIAQPATPTTNKPRGFRGLK